MSNVEKCGIVNGSITKESAEKMKIIGIGNTAEVYEYGEGKVCKLFVEGYPREYVELEYGNAEEMYRLGIRVPKPYELVLIENRNGIIYEKIDGISLLHQMMNDGEHIDEYLEKAVLVQKEILAKKPGKLLSYKDFIRGIFAGKNIEDEDIFHKIQMLPDGEQLLYGDFHFGNILITKEGEYVVIDFMNVCYGPRLYDIARTFCLINEKSDVVAKLYLSKMNVVETELEQYLDVIKLCRKYEMIEK